MTAKRSTEDKTGSLQFQGGISQIRREMLMMIRDENEEQWVDLQYFDMEVIFRNISYILHSLMVT